MLEGIRNHIIIGMPSEILANIIVNNRLIFFKGEIGQNPHMWASEQEYLGWIQELNYMSGLEKLTKKFQAEKYAIKCLRMMEI